MFLLLVFFVSPVLSTGGLLIHTATDDNPVVTTADPDKISTSIDQMMTEYQGTLSTDHVDVIKNFMSKNLSPSSIRHLITALGEDVSPQHRRHYQEFADRLTDTYYKKRMIVDQIVKTLANGTEEAIKMKKYMGDLTAEAIVGAVKKAYEGSPEWDQIDSFVTKLDHKNIFGDQEPETGGLDPLPKIVVNSESTSQSV